SPPAAQRSKTWRACSRSDSVSDTSVESRQLHAELSTVRHRRSVLLRKTFGATATEARCLAPRVHRPAAYEARTSQPRAMKASTACVTKRVASPAVGNVWGPG